MNSRQLRFVRAAAVSTIATLLAAVSHTIGGGAAPHPLLIAAVAVLFLPVSAALVGSRVSRIRVAGAVFAAQAAFHVLFQALGAPTAGGVAGTVGHAHHVDLSALGPLSTAPALDAAMLSAHLAAAVLTTLLLWHGESVVATIARWFHAAVRRGDVLPTVTTAPPQPLRSLPLTLRDAAVDTVLSRRGPPAVIGG